MNKEIPVMNRVIYKKQLQRINDIHIGRINSMKFSNISYFKNKPESHSAQKVKRSQNQRLIPIVDSRSKRIKTVFSDDRIKEENKNMYSRLVNQKPTLSSKLFAQQRQKNLQFLKRIGRYPYKPNSTMLQPLKQEELQNHTLTQQNFAPNADQVEFAMNNLQVSINSVESAKHFNLKGKIEQQEKKQYMILLWSKVIQLQKSWYSVKFLRFKNHYQIDVSPYPDGNIQFQIKLHEAVGTAMLSENDYDYQYISTHFIKFTHQTLCLSFESKKQNKKYFYKFDRRKIKNQLKEGSNANSESSTFTNKALAYRKTVFAIQNDENELKLQSNLKARLYTQHVEDNNMTQNDMSKQDIIIELSKR